ncbi:MAG: radical SAM protein [Anaerolineae bacterium]
MALFDQLVQQYDWYTRHVWGVVSHRHLSPAMLPAWSRFLHSYVVQPDQPTHLPFDIQLEITTVCNLHCIMCRGALPMGPGKHMKLDTLKTLVDQLPFLYRVVPQGLGEPMLNPAIYGMVEYAAAKGCAVEFHTNGMFLDRKRIARLMDAGLYALTVSVDGSTPATFETIRAGAKMDRVVANLETLREMKRERGTDLPHVRFHVVVTKPGLPEVPDIIRLAARLGVEVVILSPLHIFAESMIPLAVEPDEWRGLYKYQRMARELGVTLFFIPWEPVEPVLVAGGRPGWTGQPTPDGAAQDAIAPQAESRGEVGALGKRRAPCRYPWTGLYVTVEGDILPCSWALASGRKGLGNVYTDDLASVWWGEEYQAFRHQLTDASQPLPDICATCPRVANYAGHSDAPVPQPA